MDTIQLPLDFKEFLKLLNENQVEYLLIRGYAVASYGYIRTTNDIDFWVAINEVNAEKILKVLNEFGFSDVSKELFLKPSQIIRMGIPPVRIELSTSIEGVDFETCYQKRKLVNIEDLQVNLISLEDLRTNKKASGRLKDLSDLEHLPRVDKTEE